MQPIVVSDKTNLLNQDFLPFKKTFEAFKLYFLRYEQEVFIKC